MNHHRPLGCLFWKVLIALFCVSLANGAALAQEIVVNEASPLPQSGPSASPAGPFEQELPNLEAVLNEPQPAQSDSTKPGTSSSGGNRPTVEINGKPVESQAPVPTIIINGADHTIGNWHIRPTLGLAVTYDDNIFISNVTREADLYTTISPGIAVGWGDFSRQLLDAPYEQLFKLIPDDTDKHDYFFARVAASDYLFLNHGSQDTINEDAVLDTQFELSKLSLRLKGEIQTLSTPDIQIGTRVNRTVDSAELTSKYQLGEKTSLSTSFDEQSITYDNTSTFHGTALSSTEVSHQVWVNYAINPKFTGSVGTRISYLAVQENPGQLAEQLLSRAVCSPGAKLQIDASVGIEFRQISGGSGITSGIFSLAGSYLPFDGTVVTLRASRFTESAAYLAGEDATVTKVDAEIRQRLFQKFHVSVTAGFSHNEYWNILTFETQRVDNYVFVRPSVMFDINRWGTVQLSFQYQDNQSTSTFGFIDHMTMLQFNLVF